MSAPGPVRVPLLAALLLLALAIGVAGCAQQNTSNGGSAAPEPKPAERPAAEQQQKAPEYKSWTVHINDDDSFSQGGITYKIALNFTATNPTPYPNGTYKGDATASTSTEGDVGGGQLNAQAIAQSGPLQFTLEDPAGDALAALTPDSLKLAGTGTITMKAAGTATVNGASGGFANTSSQQLNLEVNGSKVTLKVDIQGHTYTFDGTISGNE